MNQIDGGDFSGEKNAIHHAGFWLEDIIVHMVPIDVLFTTSFMAQKLGGGVVRLAKLSLAQRLRRG